MKHWVEQGLQRPAAVHDRQHHARASDLVRRSAIVSPPGSMRPSRHSGLHADDAARLPQLREGLLDRLHGRARHPRSSGAAQAVDGPPYAADPEFLDLAKHPNVFLKAHPAQRPPPDWGKATPETFFRTLIDRFGANRIAWGSNFPATNDSRLRILGKARAASADVSAEDRAWIFGGTAQRLYPSLKD